MYVEVYCEETARRPVWDTVLPSLVSFTWHQEDFFLQDIEGLPNFLLGPRCPPTVRLCLGDICYPAAPLVRSHISFFCQSPNGIF